MISLPIDIWKLIESYNIKYDPKKHTYEKLADKGCLDGIKWLHCNNIKGCTVRAMDFAAEKGVEILQLSADEVAQWKKVTDPVVDNYVKDMTQKGHSESEIRGWIAFLRERIDFWTAKQLDLRIKSPTGPDEMRP